MFSTSDTIVAIATPRGRGGLGVIRISGPDASRIAGELIGRTKPFKPRHATFARFRGLRSGRCYFFPAPHSYTGEDVAEISAHGSPVVLSAILRRAMAAARGWPSPASSRCARFSTASSI